MINAEFDLEVLNNFEPKQINIAVFQLAYLSWQTPTFVTSAKYSPLSGRWCMTHIEIFFCEGLGVY